MVLSLILQRKKLRLCLPLTFYLSAPQSLLLSHVDLLSVEHRVHSHICLCAVFYSFLDLQNKAAGGSPKKCFMWSHTCSEGARAGITRVFNKLRFYDSERLLTGPESHSLSAAASRRRLGFLPLIPILLCIKGTFSYEKERPTKGGLNHKR